MNDMAEGAIPVISREDLTSDVYDDIRFQRVLVEEMGELLPAELLAEYDLSGTRSILEIGCGAGEWMRAVARQYPDLQCIGIDEDELQRRCALPCAAQTA
jgi:tRNA G46 methylase TrmB